MKACGSFSSHIKRAEYTRNGKIYQDHDLFGDKHRNGVTSEVSATYCTKGTLQLQAVARSSRNIYVK